jgi:hypothetical protein
MKHEGVHFAEDSCQARRRSLYGGFVIQAFVRYSKFEVLLSLIDCSNTEPQNDDS